MFLITSLSYSDNHVLWLVKSHFHLRGLSHRPVQTPFINTPSRNHMKSGGQTSISQRKPQQFHGWKPVEVQDFEKITNHSGGIRRIYHNVIKKGKKKKHR